MADNDTTTTDTESKVGDWKAPANQEELDSIIKDRLAREQKKFADYPDLKAKAEQFDKAQQESRPALEKATERATTAETLAATETLRADKAEVALVKGLTLTQAKRLVGTTREELEADADELLKDLGDTKAGGPRAPQQKTKSHQPKDDEKRTFARQLFNREE